MLYKHGHAPDRFSQPSGSLPSTSGRRTIADPEWHPHHLPLVCLGDPKAPRTDSTSGPMMGVPPGPAILQAVPGCTQVGSLPRANRPSFCNHIGSCRGATSSALAMSSTHGPAGRAVYLATAPTSRRPIRWSEAASTTATSYVTIAAATHNHANGGFS